ncbi:MAG: hypothetical protein C5B55_00845 [Blastocatellia bacterium]|nr:MAG: hypothetical protein C5B55_00845 [Blastocatellia bacterium]
MAGLFDVANLDATCVARLMAAKTDNQIEKKAELARETLRECDRKRLSRGEAVWLPSCRRSDLIISSTAWSTEIALAA